MSPLHRFIDFCSRVLDGAYTVCVRGSFAAWGAGSRIGRSARLVSPQLIAVGRGVLIGRFAWLNAKDDRGDGQSTLEIGSGSYIGRFVQINAWRSVVIGEHAMIADRVFISDADHNHGDPALPIMQQGDYFKGAVRLEQGCWLGIGVVVLPGVTIGRNAVVAANSVVTRDVPGFSVVAGAPACVISRP
jgi:acetyltransferase-like isoleucine patch superfamily enzyme